MANIEELRERIKAVRQQVFDKLPELAIQNTILAKALIEKNVRDVGFGAEYSGTAIPAFFFKGRELNKQGEAFIEEKIEADENMTWADLRRAQGLPTDHVNLSYTNKMWAGMGPQTPVYKDGVIVSNLGGNTQEVVDKMNWNKARYGDFLGKVLTQKEVEILTQVLIDELGVILKNNGF